MRSCNKIKQWTELDRKKEGELVIVKTADLGQRTSTRKNRKNKQEVSEENKPRLKPEVEKEEMSKHDNPSPISRIISKFEVLPTVTRTRKNCQEHDNKPKEHDIAPKVKQTEEKPPYTKSRNKNNHTMT